MGAPTETVRRRRVGGGAGGAAGLNRRVTSQQAQSSTSTVSIHYPISISILLVEKQSGILLLNHVCMTSPFHSFSLSMLSPSPRRQTF